MKELSQAQLEQELEKRQREQLKKEKREEAIKAAEKIIAILEPLDYDQSKLAIRAALTRVVSPDFNVILKIRRDFRP